MNKLLALIVLAAAITACSKQESTPAASAAPATPAPAAAAAAPVASTTASADVPKECQEYLDKMSACVGKLSGAEADAMKSDLEEAKADWASYGANDVALGAACKAVSDGHAQFC